MCEGRDRDPFPYPFVLKRPVFFLALFFGALPVAGAALEPFPEARAPDDFGRKVLSGGAAAAVAAAAPAATQAREMSPTAITAIRRAGTRQDLREAGERRR